MSPAFSFFLLALLLVWLMILGSGIAMIVAARRSRLPYPSCARCRYDLSGAAGTAPRCPECGGAFIETGIRPAGRMRRPGLMVAGITVVAISGACLLGMLASSGIAFTGRTRTLQPAPAAPPATPPPAPAANPAPGTVQ